ncbi:FHA domain-containing protein [Spirosoma spitsbergense]|uniref:FHA domain-containing protein n=1 Tax=Spirosoma spitsbergense TaxID=431554 RepID=UPI000362FCB6|nr:FHA domain-containing protein [Spirosoma spitsbergense]
MNNPVSFTIGRSIDNDLVVDQPGVSRLHARVTFVTDEEVMLEDSKSTYGTYVNGRRISSTIINPKSQIVFGQSEPIDPKSIFNLKFTTAAVASEPKAYSQKPARPSMRQPVAEPVASYPQSPTPQADPLDVRDKFRRLANLQEMYCETRESIQINGPKKQGWLRAILGLVPLAGLAFGREGAIIGIVGAVAGQIVAVELFNPTKKLLALDKEFKRDYVCPSCGTFLGNIPYVDLLRRRQCRECKAKWTD